MRTSEEEQKRGTPLSSTQGSSGLAKYPVGQLDRLFCWESFMILHIRPPLILLKVFRFGTKVSALANNNPQLNHRANQRCRARSGQRQRYRGLAARDSGTEVVAA